MASDEAPTDMFEDDDDQETTEREQREEERRKRDSDRAQRRHSDVLSQQAVEAIEDIGEPSDTEQRRLERWMTKNNCYHSNLYLILLEYNITDPSSFERDISLTLLKTIFAEAKSEFNYTDGVEVACDLFRKEWRKRVKKGSTRSPQQSPRNSGTRGQPRTTSRSNSQRGNAPTPRDGEGLEIRRWLKQKGVWQMELWEVLVEKGLDSEEKIASLKKWEVDEVIAATKLQYSQQGVNSTMQRNRFEKNLLRFAKVHRDIAVAETLLDTTSGGARIDSAARATKNLPEARELRSLLKREDIWSVPLFQGLVELGIETPDQLWETTEDVVEDLIRRLKVQRAKENTNTRMRDLFDTLLVKFRVMWRRNNVAGEEYYEDE